MVIVSNSLFAQDTSHTKLVDKYYPEAKAPEPSAPILDKATSEPLNTTLNKPASTTVSREPQVSPNVTQSPQVNNEESTVPATSVSKVPITQSPVYSDTKLGGGSITSNPNKSMGTNVSNPSTNSNAPGTIYRDTRLGSSSPLYNTYEKNDNGAGSVTTNPNKG